MKGAAVLSEFCRIGNVCGQELIIFQLVSTGAEWDGTKRSSQENKD